MTRLAQAGATALVALLALGGCSGGTSDLTDPPTMRTDCTPDDFVAGPTLMGTPGCGFTSTTIAIEADGIVVTSQDVWADADPALKASGSYTDTITTPAQWVDSFNAASLLSEEERDVRLAEVVDDRGSTLGDYIDRKQLTPRAVLDGDIVHIVSGAALSRLAGATSIDVTVAEDAVTLTYEPGDIPPELEEGVARYVWTVPGEVLHSNGDIHGHTVVFSTRDQISRMTVTFRGMDDAALAALASRG